ncbi:hypothetical protein DMB42_49250 [Nonomuraea sp. WAC 01424]|uniref:hypothetical protein n=1 Tax=Nonomuraea sp. WAC 01424 TaxID=2203200 RepID=UPI000F7AAF8B|nr:hypothetical protein [Nonomuraea sp. WAC 01424]RSM95548.1 hypothetical protein DMB42_49250 [Nonomuraea sp. WAC 01424]
MGVVSLVVAIAVGAGVGLVLRGRIGVQDPLRRQEASGKSDPNAVVVTDEEINKLVDSHGKALSSGNVDAFTSIFDKGNTTLIRDQRKVFANLRKVPLSEVSYRVLHREGRAEDSFGRAVKFTQDVAFVHRFAGIDLRPVSEWYRWTLEKASASAPLIVTKVDGAPPPMLSGSSKSMYYPGPWDIWPDITVARAGASVVLAHPQDAALARRIAPVVAGAAKKNLDFWKRNGDPAAPVPAGFVVALVKGQSQLGNLFRKEKAHEAGVSIPMPAWASLGDDVKIGGTRVVMDTTTAFFRTSAGIQEISTHELAHSLLAGLDSAEFSLFGKPNWVIEGFAEYAANRGVPINRNVRYQEGRAYLAGSLAAPFSGRLPDNTFWDFKGMTSVNYLMGHLAMRYIAQRYGDKKLTSAVVATYRGKGDDSEAALFKELGVTKADFERQWASYVRRQLA